MSQCRKTTSLLLVLSAIFLSDFRTTHTGSGPSSPRVTSLHSTIESASNDSSAAVYYNSTYGVSFHYPANYVLVEAPRQPASLELGNDFAARQPGSRLITTLNIPSQRYPYTTFQSATLELVVNPMVTLKTCLSLAVPADETDTFGSKPIQKVAFHWRERGSAAAGTGFLNRDYAGFAHGICYEFFLEVVVGSNPDADPHIKRANEREIMAQLEKVVSSVRIRANSTLTSGKPVPIIHSFSVQSLPHPLLQNVVRVSWEISGATQNEVFIRVNCPGQIPADLNPLPDRPSSDTQSSDPFFSTREPPDLYSRPGFFRLESVFCCGTFTAIPQSGSFRLQVESHGEPVSFTLFVFHLDYVTRSPAGI